MAMHKLDKVDRSKLNCGEAVGHVALSLITADYLLRVWVDDMSDEEREDVARAIDNGFESVKFLIGWKDEWDK